MRVNIQAILIIMAAVIIFTYVPRETKEHPVLVSIGTLVSVNKFNVISRISGLVEAIPSFSQLTVKKNDVLVVLSQKKQKQIIYHEILAPFDGKIGIWQVNIGEQISAGALLTTLHPLNLLHVQFNVPETLLKKLHLQQPIKVTVNPSKINEIKLAGKISAIHAKTNSTAHEIEIDGEMINPDSRLNPGMLAIVKIKLSEKVDTQAPETALSHSKTENHFEGLFDRW